MAYSRLNLAPGTVLTAAHIKHIEDALSSALPNVPSNGQVSTTLSYFKGTLTVHLHGLDRAQQSDGLYLRVFHRSKRRASSQMFSHIRKNFGLVRLNEERQQTIDEFPDEWPRSLPEAIPNWMPSGVLTRSFPITSSAIASKRITIDLTTWLLNALRDYAEYEDQEGKLRTYARIIGTRGGGLLHYEDGSTQESKADPRGSTSEFAFGICDSRGNLLGPMLNSVSIGGCASAKYSEPNGELEKRYNLVQVDVDYGNISASKISRSTLYVRIN